MLCTYLSLGFSLAILAHGGYAAIWRVVLNLEPFGTAEKKRQYVLDMFDRMADEYDRMNRILSLGRDMSWRRTLVERANVTSGALVLDVAAGTGDVTRLLAERVGPGKVVALDLSRAMLSLAASKLARDGGSQVTLVQGDGLRLPFLDDTFDSVTSAFVLRNATDIGALFAEMRRVLRPCGRVACMEISKPTTPVFRRFFGLYFNEFVPLLGRMLARDGEAYTYLPDSLNRFMTSEKVMAVLRAVGFQWVSCQKLMAGTVSIYVGLK